MFWFDFLICVKICHMYDIDFLSLIYLWRFLYDFFASEFVSCSLTHDYFPYYFDNEINWCTVVGDGLNTKYIVKIFVNLLRLVLGVVWKWFSDTKFNWPLKCIWKLFFCYWLCCSVLSLPALKLVSFWQHCSFHYYCMVSI